MIKRMIAGIVCVGLIVPIAEHETRAFDSNSIVSGVGDIGGAETVGIANTARAIKLGGAMNKISDGLDIALSKALSLMPGGSEPNSSNTTASSPNNVIPPQNTSQPPAAAAPKTPEQCIAELPRAKRIGQVIMPGTFATTLQRDAVIFKQNSVGNAIIMTAPANLNDGSINKFKTDAGNSMLVATDVEGGLVDRFKGLSSIPTPEAVASTLPATDDQATLDAKHSRDVAIEYNKHSTVPRTVPIISAEGLIADRSQKLSDIGVSMVFGPLADVGPVGKHGAMGNRVFSDKPTTVATYVRSYIDGWKKGDIMAVIKHFPGNGSTLVNTDSASATTPPLAQLKARDWKPYEQLASPSTSIMVGNQIVPDWTQDLPSSLSSVVYTQARQYAGPNGLLITDSLTAKAITVPVPEAITKALIAGADIALYTNDKDNPTKTAQTLADSVKAIDAAVTSNKYPETQLNASVARVLAAKKQPACSMN